MTTILVTVGSTRFEALSDTALSPSFMDTLPSLGVSELVVQLGSARVPDHILRGGEYTHQVGDKALRVRVLEYTNGLAEMEKLVKSADVVISHSGSGTILSVLRTQPPLRLLVVPNAALMDNHQQELADALHKDGYLDVCRVDDLLPVITRILTTKSDKQPFPAVQPQRFAGILDQVAGFT